jgi:hypothetical protein
LTTGVYIYRRELYQFQTISRGHYTCGIDFPALFRYILGRFTSDTTLCDTVCQWLAAGRWFSPGTPVSATNKTYCHYITEILLKVELTLYVKYEMYLVKLLCLCCQVLWIVHFRLSVRCSLTFIWHYLIVYLYFL